MSSRTVRCPVCQTLSMDRVEIDARERLVFTCAQKGHRFTVRPAPPRCGFWKPTVPGKGGDPISPATG